MCLAGDRAIVVQVKSWETVSPEVKWERECSVTAVLSLEYLVLRKGFALSLDTLTTLSLAAYQYGGRLCLG